LRSSGSPPVKRTVCTPWATAILATRVILLEGEPLGLRQEGMTAAEARPGHAVHAPEVAPIGDRDPQVPQRPTSVSRRGLWGCSTRTSSSRHAAGEPFALAHAASLPCW